MKSLLKLTYVDVGGIRKRIHCFLLFVCSPYSAMQGSDGEKVEYRVWNPFRSKLAAGVLGGKY